MKRNFAAEIRERWFTAGPEPIEHEREQLGRLLRWNVEVRRQRHKNGVWVPEIECRVCSAFTTNPEPYCDEHIPF